MSQIDCDGRHTVNVMWFPAGELPERTHRRFLLLDLPESAAASLLANFLKLSSPSRVSSASSAKSFGSGLLKLKQAFPCFLFLSSAETRLFRAGFIYRGS